MEVIGLDIRSRFGAFNKPYSTTGGRLTYPVPTKPAITGILGAILGFSFQRTVSTFQDLKVGIKPLSEIQTKSVVFNSHYGGRKGRMVNVRQEILVDPAYRIYIDLEEVTGTDEDLSQINEILSVHQLKGEVDTFFEGLERILTHEINYYSPYMGKNDFPLEFSVPDIQLADLSSVSDKHFETNSIVPKEACLNFNVSESSGEADSTFGLNVKEPRSLKFQIIRDLPVSQNENREFEETKDFVMKSKGKNVDLTVKVDPKRDDYRYYRDENGKMITVF